MTDLKRDEFESAFTEEMVSRCGEGFRSSVRLFFVEREPDGTYSNPIAFAGWWAWQASRQALVVVLPPEPTQPEAPEFALDDSHMDAFHAAVRMRDGCHEAITVLGLRVYP